PNLNQEWQRQTNSTINISGTKTGDTSSEQDGAFKEDDVETPSPSDPEEPDLGFPLSSKRGAAEGLNNASKKENDVRRRRRCQHRQAEQEFLPGLRLSNPIATVSGNKDEDANAGRNHHVGRGLAGLQLLSKGGTASEATNIGSGKSGGF
uniref:Uncharacterized protein n=1 Tax=Triticum urartu TaxID=4572 RepID=A0A8R7PRI3_TRIUA